MKGRAAALLLALSLCLGLFGCGGAKSQDRVPLVVGCNSLGGRFSPFYAESSSETDVVNMTQQALLTTDRTGAVVYKAIEGETRSYNGTDYTYKGIADLSVRYDGDRDETTYTWTLKKGVKFSDGTKMTADDVIFSYYVLLDPAYTGRAGLSALPIVGLRNYQTQTTDAVYSKYSTLAGDIYAAGRERAQGEMEDWYWDVGMKQAWMDQCRSLVDYCMENYADKALERTGYTEAELRASESLQVLFGMAMWDLVTIEGQIVTGLVSGESWRAEDSSLEHYYNETMLAYGGDPEAFFQAEATGDESQTVLYAAATAFIAHWGPKDADQAGQRIERIEGIEKRSDYEVSVTIRGMSATAVYQLGIPVAPLHYYGDLEKYDYEAGLYGHDFGDLSAVEAKSAAPLGAGPYRLVKYENKVAYFEANTQYWRGEPLTYYVQFKETQEADKISGVQTGAIDIASPSFSKEAEEEIRACNPDGSLAGAVIAAKTVDFLGYGYVGINAGTVNVGGNPSSEASRNLRKAFATVLAAYRALSVRSYYGERAEIINYPISDTSWAAPRITDAGYSAAYALDVEGAPIYSQEMDEEARFAAAKTAAVGFLQAAGFTWNAAAGKFTAAPPGAKLEYELIVPGGGGGDHPSFLLATKFQEVMGSIGIQITVNDPSDGSALWEKLGAGTQELWCATWAAGLDPDMYTVYHSSNIPGAGGSDFNYFSIANPELDQLLSDSRKSLDQDYRKLNYRACLDIILDWAVEIPVYQRQACYLFSAERIDLNTLTPDITTYWGWINDIERLEMNVA